ncbi:unnamed protein product, partial [Rotaria socialis]
MQLHFNSTRYIFQTFKRTRRTILKQAQESIRHQQQLTKLRYDKYRKDMSYCIGDLVFLKVCANRTKLDERWIGPCQMINNTDEQKNFVQNNES